MVNDVEVLKGVRERKFKGRLLFYADFIGETFDNIKGRYGVSSPHHEELKEKLGFFLPETVFPERKKDAPKLDFSRYYKDIKIPDGVKISDTGELYLPGSYKHFTHLISPLRDIYDFEEIKEFPIYKKAEHFDFSHYKKRADDAHKKGKVCQAWVGRFFETSWPLRGYENMLADMVAEPDTAEYFLDIETDFNVAAAEAAAKAGADMIVFGDDVGSQNSMTFSADLWREMLKPRFKKVFSAAKKIKPDIVTWYHSCGHITPIIPDLIEVGLDVLNPFQPESMDIWELHKNFGDRLSFDGGIGTQSTMPFGTPKEVDEAVRKLVNVYGKNGGLILAPSHILEPEVPVENIVAFIESAKKYCN